MRPYVFGFQDIDTAKIMAVGGKGANLGELSRIEGIHVPGGFCISTEAFGKIIEDVSPISELLARLAPLTLEDRAEISAISGEIRRSIEEIAIPEDIEQEILRHLANLGENHAYAVRSSATAEDLPTASFAGQQDTYLNIIGKQSILKHVSKCWASLFTERAVMYRLQNGFDHRSVSLAVIIQKMVSAQAAGIIFTADPITSNRKITSIDASFGLGEAVVSGLVNPDSYKVRNGQLIDKQISIKKLAIYGLADGGTGIHELEPERQSTHVLADEQIMELERLGRKIESHFGCPQDIEWCLVDDTFYMLQSRPITTLYPIPETSDQENHVYLSVGHQQMMTDAMRPLGLSLWQLTAGRPMFKAGGRLFVDIAQDLASPARREMLVNVLGKFDPLIKDILMTIIERDYVIEGPENQQAAPIPTSADNGAAPANFQAQIEYDPTIVSDLINRSRQAIEGLRQGIQNKSGPELFDFILEDIRKLRGSLSDPQSFGVFMTAMNASSWVNEKMNEWLGEKSVADTLSQSVPNNITSAMGLALLDVADVIRPYPEVIAYLQQTKDDKFLDGLAQLEGGPESRDAICAYLSTYGMRCVGEIDITRTRWSENPTKLVPMILNHIKNFAAGAGKQKFNKGLQEALEKEQELLARLSQLPDSEQEIRETKKMIDLIRNFIGYREYPKYDIVNRYFIYKQALLKEAERFIQANIIHEQEDIYYLTLEELIEISRTNQLDYQTIAKRKDEYRSYEKLTPPRVMTSDGEIFSGAYKQDHLPTGAIAGLPVSSGVIEGRARVILNIEDADLEEGDILVTTFTDPSWTPLFVSIKGLVTEVGGLMTHGAVIAREYGLPAVVGVDNATKLIQDGQRIRVHGTEGYVEIL